MRARPIVYVVFLSVTACPGEQIIDPDEDELTPLPSVLSVDVSPGADTLVAFGETVQLSATARAANGSALSGKTITWASSDAACATVDAAGLVTAVENGTATISAAVDGVQGTALVTVVAASPGKWEAPTEFGAFQFTVDSEGLGIEEVRYAFSRWTCGSTTQSGSITITRASPGWPITVGQFELHHAHLGDLEFSVSGTFDASDVASGSWTAVASGTTCEGTWDGEPWRPVATVLVDPASATVSALDTVRLSATALAADGDTLAGRVFEWSSSDTLVASVWQNGVVRGGQIGSAIITATSEGQAASATVTVTPPANTPPVADAGEEVEVIVGDRVRLDGSGSSDADGDSLTYLWTIAEHPSGSSGLLASPTNVNPTLYPLMSGEYVVQLTVDDGRAVSAPSFTTIRASNPDVAVTHPLDNAVITESSVTLTAAVDGNNYAVDWVVFAVDGHRVGSSDRYLPYSRAWESFYWADDGVHTITATARYNDGSESADSISVTVSTAAARSPEVTAPQDQALALNTDSVPVVLSWRPVADASEYHVEISSTPDFTIVALSATTMDTSLAPIESSVALAEMFLPLEQDWPPAGPGGETRIAQLTSAEDCPDCFTQTIDVPGPLTRAAAEDLPCAAYYFRLRAQNEFGLYSAWSETRRFDYVDINGVMNGQGIAEAADYVVGPGLHQIVVVGDFEPEDIPPEWPPLALGWLELVGYGDRDTKLIQTCNYTPWGTIERYQHTFEVVVYAARTGQVVDSRTFTGSLPETCPFSDSFYIGQVKSYYGSTVAIETVISFLETHVNP